MKKLISASTLVFTWIFLSSFIGITDDVSAALKKGNAFKISAFFNKQIDITILEKSDLLTKLEAEKLLFDFFHENQPSDFSILHQGKSRSGQEYIIGTLKTSTGAFRVSYYIKKENSTEYIQQFIIETD